LARSIGSPEAVRVVQNYINSKGWNHEEFAKKVGTTGRTIRKFLKEGVVMRRIFVDIAEYLKLSTDELLRGETPKRTD
jgi:predicted transcriptional regulator